MPKPGKTRTYALYNGRTKVYIGASDDLKRRAKVHRRSGHTFTRIVPTSRAMTKEGARRRKQEHLNTYRRTHKGRSPRYNDDPKR